MRPCAVVFSSKAIISQFIPIIVAKVLGHKMSKMIDSYFLNKCNGKIMGRVVKVNNSYFDEFGQTIVIKGTPPLVVSKE